MDKNSFGASLVSAPISPSASSASSVAATGNGVDAPAPRAAVAGLSFAAPPASPDYKPSHCVNAELLLSTPLTVVVRARLEYFDVDGLAAEREVALVIPRARCEGDHPYWPALLSAAQEHWQRCPGHARRLSASVEGDWQTLLAAALRH